ncbi:MAG: CDP-alcohol phosphatidyltransferase family protein [Aquificota bacterium]|jgi:phosphatidylglycerophosphate synthase|uniref:CDP-alcohol phosphatidyltransferase family protein n=1 Tax=Hydrogenobacter sp. TaxID=2152829 RepID=A0A7C2Z3P1_9AQUI|nr:MAG: CDP-alcohol phosphatidyltransferase family protein [Aquificota bacterium]
MSYLVRELKPTFERLIEPLVDLLNKLGTTPNLITILGLLLVAIGSLFLYLGQNFISFIFLLLGALCDAIDGSLARRLGKNSPFGAFFDSLMDRVSDALPFIAISLSSEDKVLSLFSMLAMVFSYTVSYARARAEGLGYELKVGAFERPERWIVLLLGIALDMVLLAVLIIAIGSLFTTLQRAYIFMKIQRR